ncbi:hypothetical protein [Halomarina oriensis]|uniref:Uncharacterized protein n=1 Tax=Halomarina oriensis TaxID=671145 RepID=A0A6B0GRG6_9EURY|nr:hypothetical protein [Halomarina oriensis]MWG36219.1 hypothetical protein [Halomarina oriensis]
MASEVTINDDTEDYAEYEARCDELNEGLLKAYAAGFSKALETFDVQVDFDTDPESIQENRFVMESHYYFWDGRLKPLKLFLRDQFHLDEDDDRAAPRCYEDGCDEEATHVSAGGDVLCGEHRHDGDAPLAVFEDYEVNDE